MLVDVFSLHGCLLGYYKYWFVFWKKDYHKSKNVLIMEFNQIQERDMDDTIVSCYGKSFQKKILIGELQTNK